MAPPSFPELICSSRLPEELSSIPHLILAPKNEESAPQGVMFYDPRTEMKEAAWQCAFRKWEWRGESGGDKEALTSLVEEIEFALSDVSDFGAQVLKNLFSNLGHLSRARSLKGLEGSLRGTPAFICGAGPSLSENAEMLRDVPGLIFAAGCARKTMHRLGIKPHFLTALDPHPLESSTYFQDVPLLFQLRATPKILNEQRGPLFWVPEDGVLEVERALCQAMNWQIPTFDVGWNASTFGFAAARFLGCSPIILVGVDLGSAVSLLYAGEDSQEEGAVIGSRGGRPVYGKADWKAAARWLENAAQGHEVLRLLSKGLPLEGIQELPLKEILRLLPKQYALPPQGELIGCDLTALEAWQSSLHENAESILFEPMWRLWAPLFLRESSEEIGLHRHLFFQRLAETYRAFLS